VARTAHPRPRLVLLGVLAAAAAVAAAVLFAPSSAPATPSPGGNAVAAAPLAARGARGVHRIRHVVVIMQENRSFDSYFGTFPGADGLPTRHGHFTTCLPDPASAHCVRPYHDHHEVNGGGSA